MILSTDTCRADIRADLGGSVASLQFRASRSQQWQTILRPTPAQATTGRQAGLFPLVPYSNRINQGQLHFQQHQYQLHTEDNHAIHGIGCYAAWRIIQQTDTQALLRLEHHANRAWPWSFIAEQHFALSDQSIRCKISMRNTGTTPCPAGIGFHPYFLIDNTTRLTATVANVERLNQALQLEQPQQPQPALPLHWQLNQGVKPLELVEKDLALDHSFNGFQGRAKLEYHDYVVNLSTSELFKHLIVYTPQAQPLCAVEPVSHCINAFNRASNGELGTGTLVLQPNDIISGWLDIGYEQPTTVCQ